MADLTNELGHTGLALFSGQVAEDFLQEFRGRRAFQRYREMLFNSPVIGALALATENSVRGVKWQYTSNRGPDDPRLALLERSLAAMSHSWNDHISEALNFLWYGFYPFEIVYQRVNGEILWRKFAPRAPDTVYRWDIDETGGVAGFIQQAPPFYRFQPLPIERLIIYRSRVEKNNPEGRSLLRTAWIPYYFCKHTQQAEGIGIERDLAGLPVIEMPPGSDTTESESDTSDYGRAHKIVRNIRNDEQAGVVLPAGWKLSLLSTGGSRQFDTDKVVNRYENRMLMSALAQFLMLGQEGVGSLALSKDQTSFWSMSVDAIADIIGETHSKHAAPRLLALNGYDADGIQFEHSPAGDVDVQQVADFLQRVGSLITWTPEDEVWLRQLGKLPERTAEELMAEKDKRRATALAIAQPKKDNKSSDDDGDEEGEAEDDPQDEVERMRADFRAAMAEFRAAMVAA